MKNQDLSKADHSQQVGCSPNWSIFPFCQELERQGVRLSSKGAQASLGKALKDQTVGAAICSPDRLLRNGDYELALPVGEVVHGASGLAYLTIENCHEFKDKLQQRVNDLREVFAEANLDSCEDLKGASKQVWSASKNLAEPRFKYVPYLNLAGGCGSYASLARIIYRLLFGGAAYETNELMQGSGNGMQQVSLELRQGNEGLVRRSSYRVVVDLVEMWTKLTGMPFVASVLVRSRQEMSPIAKQLIIEAAERAQVRMKVEPSNYLPDIAPTNSQQQKIDLQGVWKDLNYRLVAEDFRSLMFYLHLLRPLVKKHFDDETFLVKMLRWQDRDSSAIH